MLARIGDDVLNKFVGKDFAGNDLQVLRGDISVEKIPAGAAHRLDLGYAQIPDPFESGFLDRVHHPGIVRDLNGRPIGSLWPLGPRRESNLRRPAHWARLAGGGLHLRNAPLI